MGLPLSGKCAKFRRTAKLLVLSGVCFITLRILLVYNGLTSRRKANLVVVTMFHNEAPYLLEWITHHTIIGVDRFHLYNHNSTDNYREVLEPFIKRKQVILVNTSVVYRGTPEEIDGALRNKLFTQISCLRNYYKLFSRFSTWSVTIDIDEFIWPTEQPIENSLRNLLLDSKFKQAGGISLARVPFSTNGRIHRLKPQELQMMEFFERKRPDLLSQEMPKIIYRSSSRIEEMSHLHRYLGATGPLFNMQGYRNGTAGSICHDCSVPRVEEPFVLLHYLGRSLQSCIEKRKRSEEFNGGWRHNMHPDYCLRLHRRSSKFDKRSYKYAYGLEKVVKAYKNKLCNRMYQANVDYSTKWAVCSQYNK